MADEVDLNWYTNPVDDSISLNWYTNPVDDSISLTIRIRPNSQVPLDQTIEDICLAIKSMVKDNREKVNALHQ